MVSLYLLWTLKLKHKALLSIFHDALKKYAAIKAGKNLAENTVLTVSAVLLRKMVLFKIYQLCFVVKVTALLWCYFLPQCSCAWRYEVLSYFLGEWTYLNYVFIFIFNFFWQEIFSMWISLVILAWVRNLLLFWSHRFLLTLRWRWWYLSIDSHTGFTITFIF